MKVRLIRPWSRANTKDDGAINGWVDYRPGEIVEVSTSLAKSLVADRTAEEIVKKKPEPNDNQPKKEKKEPEKGAKPVDEPEEKKKEAKDSENKQAGKAETKGR